ncbi:Os11g0435150 [Oryza sativa Japonica Group]|uniref:Os11g0435150 protein n=1 Tax=Oryza sativa subsp. japonica TaxID=39947 RepID=A0A0P0Y1N0_ORYSJ|nr:Os11g0435150 [Oryza sativa Japonica Group]
MAALATPAAGLARRQSGGSRPELTTATVISLLSPIAVDETVPMVEEATVAVASSNPMAPTSDVLKWQRHSFEARG